MLTTTETTKTTTTQRRRHLNCLCHSSAFVCERDTMVHFPTSRRPQCDCKQESFTAAAFECILNTFATQFVRLSKNSQRTHTHTKYTKEWRLAMAHKRITFPRCCRKKHLRKHIALYGIIMRSNMWVKHTDARYAKASNKCATFCAHMRTHLCYKTCFVKPIDRIHTPMSHNGLAQTRSRHTFVRDKRS